MGNERRILSRAELRCVRRVDEGSVGHHGQRRRNTADPVDAVPLPEPNPDGGSGWGLVGTSGGPVLAEAGGGGLVGLGLAPVLVTSPAS